MTGPLLHLLNHPAAMDMTGAAVLTGGLVWGFYLMLLRPEKFFSPEG